MKLHTHTKLLPSILLLVALSLLNVKLPTARAEYLENAGRQGRTLLQTAAAPAPADVNGTANVSTNYLVLAEHRTARQDPLNETRIYRGGYDIKNEHYWASVGFTGAVGFVLAAAWLLLGAALFLLLCCCCCCCRRRLKGAHAGGNFLILLLLLLLTGAAVLGCVLVYLGQGKLHNELSDTLNYVINQSDIVVVRLRNTSEVLSTAESISVVQFGFPPERKAQIEQLDAQLTTAANNLETQTDKNSDGITTVLNRVRLAMIVVAGVMLLLVLLGFLFSTLGISVLMYLLVIVVWVLIAGTWILCGVYIMLNNVIGDTCIAMEEWVANPSAQTSLQDILSCVDVNTTNNALSQSRATINDTVNGVNVVIAGYLNFGVVQPMPLMCNPVQPKLNPPGCVNASIASQAWQPFVCNNSAAPQNCPLQGRLTPQIYGQLNQSAFVVDGLDDNIPFLLDLANCRYVRQVFTVIRQQRCRPLRKYLKWQYIGLALIAGGFMFSIFLWIIFSRRRKHRFTHHNEKNGHTPQFMARGPDEAAPPKVE